MTVHFLGIDLGTTNTVAAVDGKPLELGEDENNDTVMPSVVAFPPNSAVLVGEEAYRRRVIDPANTIYAAKRVLGRPYSSETVTRFRERYPFAVREAPNDEVRFSTRAGHFSPEQVASFLIRHVRESLPVGDVKCVVTVPASFGDKQRTATAEAVRKAGIADVTVIDEPVAAAFAYTEHLKTGIAAVYDLGGGTFDFTLLDCGSKPFKVLASDGDPFLGGEDMDHALAEWARVEILKRHGIDLQTDREAWGRLMVACEKAKIRLSHAAMATIEFGDVDPDILPAGGSVSVDPGLLTTLASHLLRRTFVICEEVLGRAQVNRTTVDTVVLAGGPTNLPLIRAGIERFFGKSPKSFVSPSQVVCIGASHACRTMHG